MDPVQGESTASVEDPGKWALLRRALASEPTNAPAPLWLVLIGHGTFDGKEARFNLRGPDLTATELALWLQPIRRPMAVIDTSSPDEFLANSR